MIHVIIISLILLGYGMLALVCWLLQAWLVAVFDWLWLDAQVPEGELTTDTLRKLWGSPTDGEAAVSFDQEGQQRQVARHLAASRK